MVVMVGNFISILGVLVTFYAYGVEHRGRRLPDLEPRLVKGWRAFSLFARKVVRRPLKPATGTASTSWAAVAFSGAMGVAWETADGSDDLDTRVAKMEHNLDSLKRYVAALHTDQQAQRGKMAGRFNEGLAAVRTDLAKREAQDKTITTQAMRWQVRGLFLVLIGTVFSLFGV